ncbi:MAG: type II toxin-antitoxin system RelE family toxin [Prochlorotrichaceae cyanobacterium]
MKGLPNLLEAKTAVEHNDRLGVGNYRILFEIEDDAIVIYRVKHRRDAYSS